MTSFWIFTDMPQRIATTDLCSMDAQVHWKAGLDYLKLGVAAPQYDSVYIEIHVFTMTGMREKWRAVSHQLMNNPHSGMRKAWRAVPRPAIKTFTRIRVFPGTMALRITASNTTCRTLRTTYKNTWKG